MGGAWFCLHLIEHYKYTKDREFLKEYYGILKDAVKFFLQLCVMFGVHWGFAAISVKQSCNIGLRSYHNCWSCICIWTGRSCSYDYA
ncbi:MAG: glycosyl hydrolase family 95 catalytic domain-containing protein [Mediterraneibacter faecis]